MLCNIKKDKHIEIIYNNTLYRVLIRRSYRKSISLSVKLDGSVVIYSPEYTLELVLQEVVRKNILWISNRVSKMLLKNNRISLSDGSKIPFLGSDVVIKVGLIQSKECIFENNILFLRAKNPVDIRLSLCSFYRCQAKKIFSVRTKYWIDRIEFTNKNTKIAVKSMKTRWGSMSSSGRMSLNVSLIQTPLDCIDYVIVHELCHQKYPHHQRSFWLEVSSIIPDYKDRSDKLKHYSIVEI